MNVSMSTQMTAQVARSAPAAAPERMEVKENDRDTDDRAARAAAKPSVNLNGQALGQLLNAVA